MQRLFERDHDIRFDIAAALRTGLALSESAERRTSATAAEKLFEEIAEAGPAEFELHATAIPATRAPSLKSATRLTTARAPARRWLEPAARVIPIRAELIVFLPLLRIAQDFVGFVDLLKFFLGDLFI